VRSNVVKKAVSCGAVLLMVCNQPELLGQSHPPSPTTADPVVASAEPAASRPAERAPIKSVYRAVETSGRDNAHELTVGVGKSAVIDTDRPVQRVAVGLGEYAEATAVSPSEILVNGKAAGETSLILWETGNIRQFYRVTVSPVQTITDERVDAITRQIQTELPGQVIKATVDNGVVFLRGTVRDLNSSDRAVQIASTAGKVVNLLYVDVPPANPQVLLKVRFASVDRSLSKQLGLNLFSTGLGNTIGTVSTGQFSPPSVTTPSGTTGASATISNALNLMAFYPGINLGATIEALESKGLVQTLAEPNLLAESGRQASFLAGGEYPYPVVQGTGSGSAAATIEFKEYGIRLNFLPTVTPRGTIHLQVAPEVSSLDFTNAVEVSGFVVPAIDTRKVKTAIELGDGQSFAIGGLLDNRETETLQKIPFIGDIPILGKLFNSVSKNRTNTELIVIVTPEIVYPSPAGKDIPVPKYPEKCLPPNSNTVMNTPEAADHAAAMGRKPKSTSLPVEQLIQSLQPEAPMVIDSSSGGFGKAGTGSGGGGGATSAAPPQ